MSRPVQWYLTDKSKDETVQYVWKNGHFECVARGQYTSKYLYYWDPNKSQELLVDIDMIRGFGIYHPLRWRYEDKPVSGVRGRLIRDDSGIAIIKAVVDLVKGVRTNRHLALAGETDKFLADTTASRRWWLRSTVPCDRDWYMAPLAPNPNPFTATVPNPFTAAVPNPFTARAPNPQYPPQGYQRR